MKYLQISELRPGMKLGEDIFNQSGQLVFPAETILTDSMITRMEFYTIIYVKILNENPQPEPDEEPSFSKRIRNSQEFHKFTQQFKENLSGFEHDLNDVVNKNTPLDTTLLLRKVTGLLDAQNGHVNIFNMLHNMRDYDDSTFTHSMNVALICMVMAGWLHMPEEDVKTAVLCGLLHDIGKLRIPDCIIKKPASLTPDEMSIIQTHPLRGYDLLKQQDISIHIKNAALMHHEKCDGTGYPFGLTGDETDPFAKLVAIADVYDATTSARIYRGPLCPFQVVGLFETEGLQKYDTKYILTFLENVVNSYLFERVELNDGTIGEIVFINKRDLSRPLLKSMGSFIDLSHEKHLSIVKIV